MKITQNVQYQRNAILPLHYSKQRVQKNFDSMKREPSNSCTQTLLLKILAPKNENEMNIEKKVYNVLGSNF